MKGLLVLAACTTACATGCATADPPLDGYGPRYQGTGEVIFVKDSRNDWDVSEGNKPITADQALQAANDVPYEERRRELKEYNALLKQEADRNQLIAWTLGSASAVSALVGVGIALVVSPLVTDKTQVQAPSETTAEIVKSTPNAASLASDGTAIALMLGGTAGFLYAIYGGSIEPPYVPWTIPDEMNRPAYVRRPVEAYNAKIAPSPEKGARP